MPMNHGRWLNNKPKLLLMPEFWYMLVLFCKQGMRLLKEALCKCKGSHTCKVWGFLRIIYLLPV